MKAVTFGEIMLRLATIGYERFVQAEQYGATFGGGEANVAVSLANYGWNACFVTKLPTHEIGQAALNSLRRYGVNTSYIVRGGERVGIYYLEKGASQRASKVIYDRAGSAISMASSSDFEWEKIFADTDWFHITGITPALNPEVAKITLEAARIAKEKGVTVSCDLNYRKKLWSKQEANATMEKLMPFVDVLIANEEDCQDVFGISGGDVTKGEVSAERYQAVAEKVATTYRIPKVAITLRKSLSASDNLWSACLYSEGRFYKAKEYPVHIVDRVGGGDSFAAGLIHGLTKWRGEEQKALEYAVSASCLKHSIEGDFNLVSEEEVMKLAGGDGSGRVSR